MSLALPTKILSRNSLKPSISTHGMGLPESLGQAGVEGFLPRVQAKIAELEASLGKVLAEKATALERQRSAGKPPRPPNSGSLSPCGGGSPSSPFGRSGSGGDASLHIASLEIQVVYNVHCTCYSVRDRTCAVNVY